MRTKLFCMLAFVVAMSCLVMAVKAEANTYIYTLTDVQLNDGGVLSGTITITDGYLGGFNLQTTAGSSLVTPFTYTAGGPIAGNINNIGGTGAPDDSVQFFANALGNNGYEASLQLTFAYNLTTPWLDPTPGVDPILGGSGGPSWECNVGFSCPPFGSNTPIRYVLGGDGPGPEFAVTAVPETATWAMMLIGFAAVGFVAYRRSINRANAIFVA